MKNSGYEHCWYFDMLWLLWQRLWCDRISKITGLMRCFGTFFQIVFKCCPFSHPFRLGPRKMKRSRRPVTWINIFPAVVVYADLELMNWLVAGVVVGSRRYGLYLICLKWFGAGIGFASLQHEVLGTWNTSRMHEVCWTIYSYNCRSKISKYEYLAGMGELWETKTHRPRTENSLTNRIKQQFPPFRWIMDIRPYKT